jgi:hypothetical protein
VEPVVVEAIDRRGRTLRCAVQVAALESENGRGPSTDGVILVMERAEP